MRIAALTAALALTACGRAPLTVELPAPSTTGAVPPAWCNDSATIERTITAADTAARVWGGSPDALDGWTIRYLPTFVERRGNGYVVGLTKRTVLDGGTIEVWAGTGAECLEASDLAHEIGHVVIGDGDHEDPRWRAPDFWRAMAAELTRGVPADDAECLARLAQPDGAGIWH